MTQVYDFIVIGSGFGGSVSALRLAEKGYKVAVLEKGLRYRTEDFPRSNWNLRKYLWAPGLGLYGIQALTLLKDVFILHGTGVGGGSLVYANTLLVPPDKVFEDPAWAGTGWKARLEPHFDTARQMLGATRSQAVSPADQLLKQCAEELGQGDTFHINDVGVYFGEKGVTVPDPYFQGKGPDRTGCELCGGCMVGCRYGAKNTLDKNYLYLAEQLGVEVISETEATDVRPDPEHGYRIRTRRVTGFLSPRKTWFARQVVFAGGVMGTVRLLLQCQATGSLPALSGRLGDVVRTNSETLVGCTAWSREVDYSKGIAITSGIYPDEHTHIEAVRYGEGHDAMALTATIMVDGGGPIPRPLRFLGQILRHPWSFLRGLNPFGWARRSTILLVMQSISNFMRFDYRRRWWRLGARSMNSNWRTDSKVPSFIPVANQYARLLAEKIGGAPRSMLPEVLFDVSPTAHILGGCIMGEGPEQGVIDFQGRVHGYEGLWVADGSAIPANLGVNPSLTITALAEHFMSQVPEKG